jgi:hypothetical protein
VAVAPQEIRVAFDHGHALFKHEPLEFAIPPGTLLISFAPASATLVWQLFLFTFGRVSPAGPTSDLYFTHWQEGVARHDDPMVHSLLDFEYPIWAVSTTANPHYIELHNLTEEVQTLDLQLWMAVFPNRTAYARWYCDLILLGLRNQISDYLLSMIGMSRSDFEALLEERRRGAYR